MLTLFLSQDPLALNELTQAFSLPFPTTNDTIYWNFGYTASDSSAEWDTIYSCAISLVWDSIPDPLDRWNFGPKFPVKILDPITAISENEGNVSSFTLFQNYPNPFNPSSKINFKIAETAFTSLKVYDVLGNEVTTLVDKELSAGEYEFEFDGKYLPSGIYFYQLNARNYVQTRKMVLLK